MTKSQSPTRIVKTRSIFLVTFFFTTVLSLILLSALTVRNDNALLSSFRAGSFRTTLTRTGFHLLYWTPHKTGSMSMRTWLRTIARTLAVSVATGQRYPNANLTDWHHLTHRASRHRNVPSCGIVTGHLRVRSVHERVDERVLGAVITTFRHPLPALASKYFHRTREVLRMDQLSEWHDVDSLTSRLWFLYWNDHDPCEQLRYYDGVDGCDFATLHTRVRGIAERVDCAVDMDDPRDDIDALCTAMQLPSCEDFPYVNQRKGTGSGYDSIYEIPHVRRAVVRVERVSIMLRDALMERRCRFLGVGDKLAVPGVGPPQWPYPGCGNGMTEA